MVEPESDAERALDALRDAVALWRLHGATDAAEVIDAATDGLVAGLDSQSLRFLAGASPRGSMFELEPVVLAALNELGCDELVRTPPQREALLAMARRYRRGAVTARELVAWAHAHVGHDGPADCQPLVVLDDMYDEGDCLGYRAADLDDWTDAEVDALLKGLPSPGTTRAYDTPVPPSRPGPSRRRRWLGRRRA